MKVLVTGHQGYIGSILVPMLQAAGHQVVGLDTGWYASETPLPQTDNTPNLELDVRDISVYQLSGFQAVLHLAGISNDPVGDLDSDLTFEINYEASVRLAKNAKQAGVQRFLFASSCSLYGAQTGDEPLSESAHFDPITAYGKSKVMVEQDVASLADGIFCPTYLRCATAYGYSPRLRTDLVVNSLVASAHCQNRIKMTSDGSPWRPLVHVEDIARAYLAILHAPRPLVHNQAFNVGRTKENYQIRDVAKLVQSVLPTSEVEMAEHAEPDTRCYRVDCSKLQRTLSEFRPRWSVRQGIVELFGAYHHYGLSQADFDRPTFVRIQQIKQHRQAGRLTSDLRWSPSHLATVQSWW
ncbi:MAG: NAD-dependent epimerase/dehydratase family protein [Pirellulaceae bacterium]